jgi:hypothetical protein
MAWRSDSVAVTAAAVLKAVKGFSPLDWKRRQFGQPDSFGASTRAETTAAPHSKTASRASHHESVRSANGTAAK